MKNEQLYNRVVSWDDVPVEVARPGVTRKAYSTDEVMLVWNTVEKGLRVRPHSHEDFDQLVLILSGECDYYVSGEPHRMRARDVLLVPAGAEHFIDVVHGPCVNIDVFAPPRADYGHLTAWIDALPAAVAVER
jgi:quercetin dioxygenase-like cupin family protein